MNNQMPFNFPGPGGGGMMPARPRPPQNQCNCQNELGALNNRVNRVERQVNRLERRVRRLEQMRPTAMGTSSMADDFNSDYDNDNYMI